MYRDDVYIIRQVFFEGRNFRRFDGRLSGDNRANLRGCRVRSGDIQRRREWGELTGAVLRDDSLDVLRLYGVHDPVGHTRYTMAVPKYCHRRIVCNAR